MDEYIDKAALLESFKETIQRAEIWRDDCRDMGTTIEYADRAIIDFNESALRVKNFPTVDAVKVVRCKECKHLFDGEHNVNCCELLMRKAKWLTEITVDMNWYCADGERITDE